MNAASIRCDETHLKSLTRCSKLDNEHGRNDVLQDLSREVKIIELSVNYAQHKNYPFNI